jgi:putative transposase
MEHTYVLWLSKEHPHSPTWRVYLAFPRGFHDQDRHLVLAAIRPRRIEVIMRNARPGFRMRTGRVQRAARPRPLVNFPPAVAISRLDGRLKGVSCLRLRHELPDLRQHYRRAKRLWSGS